MKRRKVDLTQIATRAAQKVEQDFDQRSSLAAKTTTSTLSGTTTKLVALLTPDELLFSSSGLIGEGDSGKDERSTTNYDQSFLFKKLDGISLNDEVTFDDEDVEEMRERFAERVVNYEQFFAVKLVNPSLFSMINEEELDGSYNSNLSKRIEEQKKRVKDAASSLVLECKILSNLDKKHPHISQVYATAAKGCKAGFGHPVPEHNFFIITDAIKETLPDRIHSWRNKQSYEAERFDDHERRQSEVTQRLEVGLDVASALAFLSYRKIVYLLNPSKVGFDARMGRIKLFCFTAACEDGEKPFVSISKQTDMKNIVYCAPEVIKNTDDDVSVTVKADVYSFGMLLWEILVLKHPFQSMTMDKYISDVVHGKTRPHLSKHMPSSLQQLMEECWSADPEQRLTTKDVHDRLESLLLEGTELTVKSEEKIATSKSKSKRIVYKKTGTEDNNKDETADGKSVRSAEQSCRSKGSRSRDKMKPKTTESSKDEKKDRQTSHSRSTKDSIEEKQSVDEEDGTEVATSKGRSRSEEGDKSNRTRSRSKSLTRSPRLTKETTDRGKNARTSRKIKYEKDKPNSHDDPNESKSMTSRGSNRSRGSRGSHGSGGSSDSRSFRRRGTRPSDNERKTRSHQDQFETLTGNETSSGENGANNAGETSSPVKSPGKYSAGRISRSVSNDLVFTLKKEVSDDEGFQRQTSRRTKSFNTGQLPSRQPSTMRASSPKRIRRRAGVAASTDGDDPGTEPATSPSRSRSTHELRRRLSQSLSPSVSKAKDTATNTLPSRQQLIRGTRTRSGDPSNVSNDDFSRRVPGRSISNVEKVFSSDEVAQRKARSFRRRKSASEALALQKGAAVARSMTDLTLLDDDIEDADDDDAGDDAGDEIFPEFAGSNNRKELMQDTGDVDATRGEEEENKRGRLKATTSGGLIQANAKDTNVNVSKAREKFMSDHHQQNSENAAVMSSLRELREKQRRQQYNQAVAAAAAAGVGRSSRRDLSSKSNISGKNVSKVGGVGPPVPPPKPKPRSLSRDSNRNLSLALGGLLSPTPAR